MSHREKLQHAWTHLKILEQRMNEFIASDPYRNILHQYNRPGDSILVVVNWEKVKDLPPDLPLIVGDVLYNLRSSLDHLAYSLAFAHSGDKIKEGQSSFPIHSARSSYVGSGERACKQMAPLVQGIIEQMQPYHTGGEYPLGVLNELGNIDKHRHLVLTGAATVGTSISLSDRSKDVAELGKSAEIRYGPFDDQTDVARILVKRTGPNPNVQIDAEISIDVAFPDTGPAPGKIVVDELVRIFLHIRDEIFPVLEEHL